MLILGVTETIQFVDGSRNLPVMQFIATCDDVVALAAPALAGAADAALASVHAHDRDRLLNRAVTLLHKSAERGAGSFGRHRSPPVYQLLAFSGHAIAEFVRIRQAMSTGMDIFDTQTFAIAMAEDVPVLLQADDANRMLIAGLHRAGLDLAVRWIDTKPNGS